MKVGFSRLVVLALLILLSITMVGNVSRFDFGIGTVTAAPIFSDGLESGDFSAWTGTNVPSGSTVEVQSTITNTGTYAASISNNGNDTSPYCYETFTEQSTCYARFYVYFDSLPSATGQYYTFALLGWSLAMTWASACTITYNGSAANLEISTYDDNTNGWHATANLSVSAQTWYCIELKRVAAASPNGEVRLYVNGVDMADITGIAYSVYGGSDTLRLTAAYSGPGLETVRVYFDDVVISNTYIYPLGTSQLFVNLDQPSNPSSYQAYDNQVMAFNYTPESDNYGDFQDASLWLNMSGTWQSVSTNATAIVNATLNTIDYTFSATVATYVWNIGVYNSTTLFFASNNFTITFTTPTVPFTEDWENGNSSWADTPYHTGSEATITTAWAYDGAHSLLIDGYNLTGESAIMHTVNNTYPTATVWESCIYRLENLSATSYPRQGLPIFELRDETGDHPIGIAQLYSNDVGSTFQWALFWFNDSNDFGGAPGLGYSINYNISSVSAGAGTYKVVMGYNRTSVPGGIQHDLYLWVNDSLVASVACVDSSGSDFTPNSIYAGSTKYWYISQDANVYEDLNSYSYTYPQTNVTPTYSSISTNTSIAGDSCSFNCQLSDDNGLSGYVFGTNNTGTWVNETWSSLAANHAWANVTKTLNDTVGNIVSYMWYANDTSNNWSSSDQYNLTLTTPPSPVILSPRNITYATADVPLTFAINEITSWMGYSLDGQGNITIVGNITLAGLSDGSHDVILYANDTVGNMGASETIHFAVVLPDIEVINMTTSKTVVGQGFSINMSVTVRNNGESTETFNVTAYANQTITAEIYDVNLTGGNSAIVSFTWNTTGFALDNYTMSAYAWPVLGETNTANNNFTGSTVKLTLPGDINGDFKVSLADLVYLANAYGTTPASGGTPGVAHAWNPNADIDNNGIIGLTDLVILALQYGQHYP